ncbi:MAG: putative peptidoglycan lipid II flippase [Verrucomicrobiales bacterium]|jgi:putative peptidoglycan lipid II flippase
MKAKTGALRSGLFFWRNDALSRAILSSIFTVGFITAAVKGVGFLKELLVASYFGVSTVMDAFTSAFVVWAFIVGIVGGALPDALIPVYSKVKARCLDEAERLAVASIWLYFIKLLLLTGIVFLIGETIIPAFTANYTDEARALTLQFFRYLAPFSVFMGMSLILSMLLQANKRFMIASAVPAIVPACAGLALLFGYSSMGIHSLILGTVIGAGLQLVILYFAFFKHHTRRGLFQAGNWWTSDLKLVIAATIPFLLSTVVQGSAAVVDIGMAAWLDQGSVATLGYANRICLIGLTLIATATTQAVYPYLADLVAQDNWTKLRTTITKFSALIFFISLPVILFIWLAAEPIVRFIFERGEFTPENTVRVASVLKWLCLQIPFYILAVLASRVCCAMLASKFMLFCAFVNLGANIGLNLLFVRFMGIEGIALSTAIVYLISTLMLYTYFYSRVRRQEAAHAEPQTK